MFSLVNQLWRRGTRHKGHRRGFVGKSVAGLRGALADGIAIGRARPRLDWPAWSGEEQCHQIAHGRER